MDRGLQGLGAGWALAPSPARALGRRWHWMFHAMLLVADLLLVIPAFYLAYIMRYHVNWPPPLERLVTEVLIENQVAFAVFWPVTLGLMGVLGVLFEMK